MPRPFTIEVIMAAYNNPVATRLALEGFFRQSDKEFSLVVADDGSGPDIKMLVDEFAAAGMAIRHIWHEDRGFRKSVILNKAIATSRADYLVFVDNDCIPQKEFVADHRKAAREGYFAAGRRIDLGAELSDEFRTGLWDLSVLDSVRWLLWQAFRRRLRHAEHGLHLPWGFVRRWRRRGAGLLGANMALWRSDLLKVNGFDNKVPEGWGEETDLEWRLRAVGVKSAALFGRAANVHLDHRKRKGSGSTINFYADKMARNEVIAKHGIKEILSEV